jgi:hypothetical protein
MLLGEHFCFHFIRMKVQLLFLTALFVLIVSASCSDRGGNAPDERQVLESLKENQAKVFIEIDGKPFYPKESLFTGNLHLQKDRASLNISDQFEGQVILGFHQPLWYKKFPFKYKLSEANKNSCRLMIGKIIDVQNRTGEGYLLHSGTIEIEQLTEDKLIMTVDGKCGKYDGFELGKILLDIKGSIIFKKPNVLFLDMNWQDLQ